MCIRDRCGISTDITDRKRMEEALRASEVRFRSLFENSPVAYQSLDIAGRFIDVNQRLCDLLGYRADELLGRDFGELWSDGTRSCLLYTSHHPLDEKAMSAFTAQHYRQTVLVVDDTPENLIVLGELLQPYYRVRVANSGPRALRIAASDPKPDLVLLDVMMPEMDGCAVLGRLRDDPATRDIPVIFVTAMDTVEDEQRGFDLGAVDYITKPLRPAIVLALSLIHI